MPDAGSEAQKKNYVTYTIPSPSLDAGQITILEAPSLLASSGTTGFRTWEAALFLGSYLTSTPGSAFVSGNRVIELGAGTGFLSILCAKHLGVKSVLATDGNLDVVTDMKTNIGLNFVAKDDHISAAVLKWGQTLIGGIADLREQDMAYNLAIGADVTYDVNSIPSLVATLRELFELYPQIKVLISATARNEQTLAAFLEASAVNRFTVEQLDVPLPPKDEQLGFFMPTGTPIRIFLITHSGVPPDSFALRIS